MRSPVIKHNLLNFHQIIEFFFSKCASGKELAIAANLVSVAQFVQKWQKITKTFAFCKSRKIEGKSLCYPSAPSSLVLLAFFSS